MRRLLPTALLAAALLVPAAAHAEPGPGRTIQPLLDAGVSAGFPGLIAYLDDGGRRGAWKGAAGVSDVTSGRRMRPDDTFRAASNTKSFTATVVLQLAGEHR